MNNKELQKCISKGQALTYTWDTCSACHGKGERRESVSYYDVEWVGCAWCSGKGQRLKYVKITCGHSPFMPAVD